MVVRQHIRFKARSDLQFSMATVQGESMVVVSDPWELQAQSLVLSEGAFALLQMLDGQRTLNEIQRVLGQMGRRAPSITELEHLMSQFGEWLLLDDDDYRSAFTKQIKDFLNADVRHCAHSGISYPATAHDLRSWVEQVLMLTPPPASFPTDEIAVVVAPHLDLRVELDAYCAAYQGLQGRDPDRVILLGTGHEIQEGLFSLTRKSFVTPLGVMPCDVEAVERLQRVGGELCCPHDLPHRKEHALEFQLPFLQCVLANPEVPIVPILCGSLHGWMERVHRMSEIPRIRPFLEELRSLITPRTLVVVGVDFAHIGRKFGHARTGQSLHQSALVHDKRMLTALCQGEAAPFWKHNRDVFDFFNICGYSSLSLLLELMPKLRGKVLRHDFWFEEETESAVSFAAVHLTTQ